MEDESKAFDRPGNTKGGSITVPLTSCLTGLDYSVLQIKTKIVSCHTADSKPVKQEVNSTVILLPLVFPALSFLKKIRLPWKNVCSIKRTSLFGQVLNYNCKNLWNICLRIWRQQLISWPASHSSEWRSDSAFFNGLAPRHSVQRHSA